MVHILSAPSVLVSICVASCGGITVAALKIQTEDVRTRQPPDVETFDLRHGNYSSTRAQEMKFIVQLTQLASKYDLHAWYDVQQGEGYSLPHLSPLFHLHAPDHGDGMPMTLTYPSDGKSTDAEKKAKDSVYRQNGMGSFVPSSYESVDDVRGFLSSPGHFVVVVNTPYRYGWNWGRDSRTEPFNDAQAIILQHGVDEDSQYSKKEFYIPAPQHVRPPLGFSKYYRNNIEGGGREGELSKKDLVALAGFENPNKPLLVYLTSYDFVDGSLPASAIFSLPAEADTSHGEGESTYKPLFDVGELETLQKEYNVIVRAHPHASAQDACSDDLKKTLLELNGVSFDGWPRKPLRDGMSYTALYRPADVIIVDQATAVSSATMALAIDKPIIHVRRLANDQRLANLAPLNAVISDELVHGWRPEKGEKLVDAVKAGVAEFEAAAEEMAARRREFASKFYGSVLDGYEEYRLMFGILNNLPIQHANWHEDLSALRDFYPGKSALPPVQLKPTKFEDECTTVVFGEGDNVILSHGSPHSRGVVTSPSTTISLGAIVLLALRR